MFAAGIDAAERYDYRDDEFRTVYAWLRDPALASLEPGTYPIEGSHSVAYVQEYDTREADEGRFETHDHFFDVHYVIEGRERVYLCKREGLVLYERDDDTDLSLYDDPALDGGLLLEAGSLVVVAPEDAHKPRCSAEPGHREHVRKVVVKVPV